MNTEANEEKESLDENRGAKGENAGGATELEPPGEVQMQNQPSQGTVVCWERFLHVRSIRVLLVENDHSTRHVVSALLRNCNYEVLDAANGLQAWKILQDLTNHIDLVLTEVVMPNLSGIALLCKIMSHKSRKNIPVVMMSSNDSMGLVVMCLSKGAVDFLVKPIRKNELKNLWQHVWRRCHSDFFGIISRYFLDNHYCKRRTVVISANTIVLILKNRTFEIVLDEESSGSGSESGTQTQKYVKSKGSENDGSNDLTVGDGSDDGSGAQSSWTKQAVEVESSQAMSPMDQAAECQDSTCAQVIRSNAETSGNKRMHICVSGGGHVQKQPDTVEEDKDSKADISKHWESGNPVEVPLSFTGPNLKLLLELNCNTSIKQVEEGRPTPISECLFKKREGDSEKTSIPLIDVRESESTIEATNMLNLGSNATDDSKEPKFELSLKRLRGVQDTGRSFQDDHYILRRSEPSAFSRYNTSSNFLKAADGITGSSSIIGNSVEVAKMESVADVQVLLTDGFAYQGSNGVSDNIDMGSTTNKLTTQPSIRKDKFEATSTISGLHPSAFKRVKNDLRFSQQRDNPLLQGCSSKELEIQHPNHGKNYHHHNHHFHNLEVKPSSDLDDSALKKLASFDPDFGSSSVLGGPINYSLNGSASGSNRVSNGQNGSNTAINTPENNAESDVGQAGKSGSGDANNTGGGGNRVDEKKLAQREAALNKFRQKRKERCFTKKVRYQNRKKLAEQRPRVRGQFVKKTGHDSSNNCSDE